MVQLAQAPGGSIPFEETKRIAALTVPLRSVGRLVFRKPDHLEKITTAPTPERLVVDGDRLVVGSDSSGAPRVVDLGSQPAVATLVGTILGAVSGNLPMLQRSWELTATGTPADWRIVLHPRDPAAAKLVAEVRLVGGAALRSFETVAPNGDTDTLTTTAAPAG